MKNLIFRWLARGVASALLALAGTAWAQQTVPTANVPVPQPLPKPPAPPISGPLFGGQAGSDKAAAAARVLPAPRATAPAPSALGTPPAALVPVPPAAAGAAAPMN